MKIEISNHLDEDRHFVFYIHMLRLIRIHNKCMSKKISDISRIRDGMALNFTLAIFFLSNKFLPLQGIVPLENTWPQIVVSRYPELEYQVCSIYLPRNWILSIVEYLFERDVIDKDGGAILAIAVH